MCKEFRSMPYSKWVYGIMDLNSHNSDDSAFEVNVKRKLKNFCEVLQWQKLCRCPTAVDPINYYPKLDPARIKVSSGKGQCESYLSRIQTTSASHEPAIKNYLLHNGNSTRACRGPRTLAGRRLRRGWGLAMPFAEWRFERIRIFSMKMGLGHYCFIRESRSEFFVQRDIGQASQTASSPFRKPGLRSLFSNNGS